MSNFLQGLKLANLLVSNSLFPCSTIIVGQFRSNNAKFLYSDLPYFEYALYSRNWLLDSILEARFQAKTI